MVYISRAELQYTNSKLFIIYIQLKKMGMLKLVDRSRLGRGDFIHISSSLITHKDYSNIGYSLKHISTS